MLSPDEWSAVRLSLATALCAVAAGLPLATVVGYYLARSRRRGKWIVDAVVSLPLVLPPVVTGYLLLLLVGRRGPVGALVYEAFGVRIAFTWTAAALAALVVGFPLMVRAVRLGFEGVDPRLEAAARSLGAGRIEAFLRVTLPLASRGLAAGAVLGFARGLGEFGATIVVAGNTPGVTRTIPLAVYTMTSRPDGLGESWRLVALAVLLSCAALVACERLERKARRGPA